MISSICLPQMEQTISRICNPVPGEVTSQRLKEEKLTEPSRILRMKGCLVAPLYCKRCFLSHVSVTVVFAVCSSMFCFWFSLTPSEQELVIKVATEWTSWI
ncbi:hypothetical protein Hanom_Chr13g01222791 [Helianthus anomalus]